MELYKQILALIFGEENLQEVKLSTLKILAKQVAKAIKKKDRQKKSHPFAL